MPPQKAGCISLTVRPKGGLRQQDLDSIIEFCESKTSSLHAVTEGEGDARHLHAALFLIKPTAPGDLFSKGKTFWNKIGKGICAETDSLYGVMVKAEVVYNDDWFGKYLQKDPSRKVIRETAIPPEQRITHYVDRLPRKDYEYKGDPYFCNLEKMWYEMHPSRPPSSREEIDAFMACMMYRDRKINVIRNSRKLKETIRNLEMFILRSTRCTWMDGVTLDDYC